MRGADETAFSDAGKGLSEVPSRSRKTVAIASRGLALAAPASLYVAIVCAVDGARFAVVAASKSECLAQIGTYVTEQASVQLWPRSVERIRELLATGAVAPAIEEYFHRSGERWDAEWLHVSRVRLHPRSTAWSGRVPLATFLAGIPGHDVGTSEGIKLEISVEPRRKRQLRRRLAPALG